MPAQKTVDDCIAQAPIWQQELLRLRELLNGCKLTETVKWGMPVYTHEGKNVVGIGAFKSYFGLWFYDGALLADEAGVLINAQPGKTKRMRQWRMRSAGELKPALIRRYVREAIANVNAPRSGP